MNLAEFTEKIRRDKRSLARALTIIESGLPGGEELLNAIFPETGNAYRIGITGPPGAGKSTITNQLAKLYRAEGKLVAVIAVDPSSPFTGGALLGDRVRMSDIGNQEGIFIRSMAARGDLGGLNSKARDMADVFDAAGYDIIIFETVGVGQSELDIVEAADTVAVILVPESGDAIQAMKAGLMEIADFFVINKSDRPGAEQAVTAIKTILMMREHDENSWMPEIVKAIAMDNKGITETAEQIKKHKDYLFEKNIFDSRRRVKNSQRIKEIVEDKLTAQLWSEFHPETIASRYSRNGEVRISPYIIAENIISEFKKNTVSEYGRQ